MLKILDRIFLHHILTASIIGSDLTGMNIIKQRIPPIRTALLNLCKWQENQINRKQNKS